MANTRKRISTDALLELGGINGLLNELNGHQDTDDIFFGTPGTKVEKEGIGAVEEDNKDKPDKKERKVKEKSFESHEKQQGKERKESDTEKHAARAKPTQKASSDEWDNVLALLKEYHHGIDRKKDKPVFIEGGSMEVLRSCFGLRASWLVNVLVLKFIEANKDRLRKMHQSQYQLLR